MINQFDKMPRLLIYFRKAVRIIAVCLTVWFSADCLGQDLLLNDTFTDANGTAIASHTMNKGAGWTVSAGSGEIQSNELDITFAGTNIFTTTSGDTAGIFIVEIRVTSGTGWQTGHVVRWSNSSNYVIGEIINTAGGKIRIYRVVSGIPTGISEKAYTISNGTTYTLTFTVKRNNTLKLKVDDGVTVDSLSKVDAFNSDQTTHGLYTNTLTAFFDNYSMTALPSVNTFDSFNSHQIGLVVADTSSLDATYEQPIYDELVRAGMIVTKIDTNTMIDSTYNSLLVRWDSLDVVILCFGTDSASVDTSKEGGVGDVPVLILEPFYWLKFGLPDSNGVSASQDSFRVNGAFGFIDTTAIWSADDSVAFYSANALYYALGPPTFDSNALLLDLAGTDTVAVFDTLNGIARAGLGLVVPGQWGGNQGKGWTFVNRVLARLTNSHSDSLFAIGMDVVTKEELPSNQLSALKDYLELNGHKVVLVDDDSLAEGSTYNGVGNAWSGLNGFIETQEATVTPDTVLNYVNSILTWNQPWVDSLDIGITVGGANIDSTKIVNTFSSLTSVFDPDELIKVTPAVQINTNRLSNTGIGANTLGLVRDFNNGVASSLHTVAINVVQKQVFNGLLKAWKIDNDADSLFTEDAMVLIGRSFGWLFEATPPPPTDVTLTAINSKSMKIEWTDNATGEDGYSIFLYLPDSTWYAHLAAEVEIDTIEYFWPPNNKIIADVAVVSGIDTVYSASGRDTAWTLAVVPPPPFTENLTDTSIQVHVNGYLFDERFDDKDYSSDPVWTVQDGTGEVLAIKRHFRATDVSGSTTLSTPFEDASGDSVNGGEWFTSFKLSDSTANVQTFVFYPFSHKASLTDTSGYSITVTTAAALAFRRLAANGSEAVVASNSAAFDVDLKFKWHDIRATRAVTILPTDTTVTWTVYMDGDSVTSLAETGAVGSKYFTALFTGFKNDSSDIRVDNIQFRQIRPSANHDSTEYAIQDSTSGDYVQTDGTLSAGAVWHTWIVWGGTDGVTVTGLTPDTEYVFRTKARNEWAE